VRAHHSRVEAAVHRAKIIYLLRARRIPASNFYASFQQIRFACQITLSRGGLILSPIGRLGQSSLIYVQGNKNLSGKQQFLCILSFDVYLDFSGSTLSNIFQILAYLKSIPIFTLNIFVLPMFKKLMCIFFRPNNREIRHWLSFEGRFKSGNNNKKQINHISANKKLISSCQVFQDGQLNVYRKISISSNQVLNC